jgi:hypothetical protein
MVEPQLTETEMIKLLNEYRATPTLKNARKVVAYGRKHPFVLCFMNAADISTLADAENHSKET